MSKFTKYQIPKITVEDASALAKDVQSDPAFPSAENYDVSTVLQLYTPCTIEHTDLL